MVYYIKERNLPGVTCDVVDCSMLDVNQYISKIKEVMKGKEGKKVLHLHLAWEARMITIWRGTPTIRPSLMVSMIIDMFN
jgi:hypothetical protein